ncbi:peptidoglycan-binding protein [Methylocystis sp. JAN1]|uniref:peptidoglycan-binding protein n=1 Tax=Methylocystis sp. JAN1 TaxID=3397211 RepID=UPI003FA32B88
MLFYKKLSLAMCLLTSTTAFGQSDQGALSPEASFTGKGVTKDVILKFSPKTLSAVAEEISSQWNKAYLAGINSDLRAQHFFAQLATETGGMRLLEENLDYSPQRLMVVWPKRFNAANVGLYAHNPEALAIYVYGGRLGNKPRTKDGWNYRGSGLVQLTGRFNFRKRGQELKLGDYLERNPDEVRRAALAFSTAYQFWAGMSLNKYADKDDVAGVRKKINGGTNGLPEARLWLAKAKRVFRTPSPGASDDAINAMESAALYAKLKELGYVSPSPAASVDEKSQTESGLKQFQQDNGLKPTGILDDDTLYLITDPQLMPKP